MTDYSPTEKDTAVLDVADTPGMAGSAAQTVPVVPEEEGSAGQFTFVVHKGEGSTAQESVVQEGEGSAAHQQSLVQEGEGSAGHQESLVQEGEGSAAHQQSLVQEGEGSAAHQQSLVQEGEGSAAHQESLVQEGEGSAVHQESLVQEGEGSAAHQQSLVQEEDVEMRRGVVQTALVPVERRSVPQTIPTGFEEEYDLDGGWGWCIVVSGFITLFILTGISLSLATLLGAYMAELKAPESLGIWIFNVQSAVWCFAGLWAEPLSVKFTHRVVAVLSALLCAAAIMISAIIKNPYLFFVTVSLMYGIGGGICVSCCFQINRRYFSKRLGMANGLMLCGGTLGMAMMSTLAGTLHNWFDFFHSTLIMGALPLIPAVTSLITFRSKKPYWEPRQQEEEHRSHFFLATAFGGSHLVGATYVLPSLWSTPYSFSTGESVSFRDYVISIFKLSFLDGDVMAVAAVTGLTQFIMINVYTVSSYALKQANVSSNNLMVFLWVAGLADLFSRLCCSFIVDHQTINIELLYIFGQLIFMIMTFMMAFFRESWAVVLICAAGFGISLGIIYVLDILVMIYRFGHEKFQSVFGVCMVFRSFCALVIGPIGGLIRELFQDYAPTFLFYNSILFLAFVLLCHHGTCQNDVIPRLPVLPSS